MISTDKTWKCLILVLTTAGALQSQGPSFGLASTSYAAPQTAAAASPGQVLVLSVYGVKTAIPQPILHGALLGFFSESLPTQLGPVTVTFTQGTITVPVPLFGISQQQCPFLPAPCTVTSITLQVPYEMNVTTAATQTPSFTIRESGALLGAIPITPVADTVHIVNSCDITSLNTEIPGLGNFLNCTSAVTHSNGQFVTDSNPARPGEILVMYVYGLGVTNPAAHTGQRYFTTPLQNTKQTFTLSFDFRANSTPLRPLPTSSTLATPLFAGLPPKAIGVYQLNFAVPQTPAGAQFSLCDGTFITSNLTVTVLGATSFDGAQICISR